MRINVNSYHPVTISKGSFAFCRWSMTLLVWSGFFFQTEGIISFLFFLLLASAVLTIKYAPLIRLFSLFEDLFKLKKNLIMLDTKGMRFAHALGALMSGSCMLLLYYDFKFAWAGVFIFAVIKSISALGVCPGEKLYKCINDNNCCSIIGNKNQ